jgi:hypothetical protein
MKRRYVFVGLALVAALTVASTALGGPSLKKLVKKEVAKQLAGKTGPPGSPGTTGPQGPQGNPGTNGVSVTSSNEPVGANCAHGGSKFIASNGTTYACNGANGANGTARAYAEVSPRGSGGCGVNPAPQPCTFDRQKGIASVTYLGVGQYCVVATGIDARLEAAAVSVDYSETDDPEGNASAQSNTNCGATNTGFFVRTERIPTSGTIAAAPDDNVGFDIVIP